MTAVVKASYMKAFNFNFYAQEANPIASAAAFVLQYAIKVRSAYLAYCCRVLVLWYYENLKQSWQKKWKVGKVEFRWIMQLE